MRMPTTCWATHLPIGSNGPRPQNVTARPWRSNPEKSAAHYNLGNALSALGLRQDAAACYRRAIKLKPQYAAAHFNLGNVMYDLARWEDAAAAFRQALDADPSHPDLDAAFNLARSLHRAGRLD